MTTNHLENIDPALLRKGRVDYIMELPYLTNKEIREYISVMYPGTIIDEKIIFEDIAGCDLQSLFLEYKEDKEKFINAIPSK